MNTILSNYTASISELKKNPTKLIEEANGQTIAILNHNKPSAYLLSPEEFASLMEQVEDVELTRLITEREHEKPKAIPVQLDEL